MMFLTDTWLLVEHLNKKILSPISHRPEMQNWEWCSYRRVAEMVFLYCCEAIAIDQLFNLEIVCANVIGKKTLQLLWCTATDLQILLGNCFPFSKNSKTGLIVPPRKL
jgi:hypothetical protein